jgi:predicted ATPase
MLIGCLVRGYKTYSNVNFIPLIKEKPHKLSIFIGDNGAGKSSILEAIDVCFNNRDWNFNIGSKRSEAFICPVFILKKDECKISNKALQYISDFFWSYQLPSNSSVVTYDGMEKFVSFREQIKAWANPADYYLICVGVDSDKETYFTSTLDTAIRNKLRPKGVSYSDLDNLKKNVLNLYKYIYIPVEVTTKDVLSIESLELQGFMDKNLISEIENILKESRNNTSIVEEINTKLDVFLRSINDTLGKDNYNYSTPAIGQKKLHASDIVSPIIESYFANRTLQKDKKPISALSSGEQRRALIDVAHAFVTNSQSRQKELIVAIDEPEASLANRASYEQFRKIFAIAEQRNCQAIISTHWYGLLITSQNAALHHIHNDSSKTEINSFDLSNVHESRRAFPDSIAMKSFFDLISSILSIVKNSNENWIICEGSDDKKYLSKLINGSVPNLTILPVGGIANVIKIFNYLKIAVQDTSERKLIQGKIFCVIDTDNVRTEVTPCLKSEERSVLQIKRFQLEDGSAKLIDPTSNGYYSRTVLEDCLPASDYADACNITCSILKKPFSIECNPSATYAMVNYDMAFLETDSLKHRGTVKAFVMDSHNKYLISENYVSLRNPEWMKTITDFFSPPTKPSEASKKNDTAVLG